MLLQEGFLEHDRDQSARIAEQFNEAFNRGDLDAAASCFAEDCQNHGRKVGRAGVRTVLAEIKINFPDARLTTLNSVAEGERVVVRCTYSGTHRGMSTLSGQWRNARGCTAYREHFRGSAHPHVSGARWQDR